MNKYFMKNCAWLCLLAVSLIVIHSCTTDTKQEDDLESLNGEELTKRLCTGCHLLPTPALLSKKSWQGVIPHMANRLGIAPAVYLPYKGLSIEESHRLEMAGLFPSTPVLSDTAWQKIVDYFATNAPDSLPSIPAITGETSDLFQASIIELNTSSLPVVTMLEVDETNQMLYYGDANGNLLKLDSDFKTKDFAQLPNPVVDVTTTSVPTELLALNIGFLNPTDVEIGGLVRVNDPGFSKLELVFRGLARPIHVLAARIDADENDDIIVSNFGNKTGRLSWYKGAGNQFQEHVIKAAPGANKVVAEDQDGDGDQDLIVLWSHGDEGVSLYLNDKGSFEEKRLIQLPAIYGASDFEYLDFDGDGDKDIILANGDNGDNTNTLKPYHGVRVFINQGAEQFEERYFFPMYGAGKVRARDFDGDGDVDLFACSFYSDYNAPLNKSVVTLKIKETFNLRPGSSRRLPKDVGLLPMLVILMAMAIKILCWDPLCME